ncbi:MAG TPA: alpha/beta hydrolase, partial [Candidatus Limnocylindrales bacterium]|nr:alpha/beta hydrolase [Candidatus Limnocylindrales bacterium]
GAGLLGPPRGGEERRLVLAGHGFGAIVAAWTAASLGPSCAGLVLVDGGWEDIGATSELTPAEFVRTLEEPPEVLRSLDAFLADRRSFDPATWDADQERASRASVIELPAGRVVPVTPPHALGGIVEAMFAYRPSAVLPAVAAPIVALVAGEVDEPARDAALEAIQATLVEAGRRPIDVRRFRPVGHNLMRYRPVAVAAAILGLVEGR